MSGQASVSDAGTCPCVRPRQRCQALTVSQSLLSVLPFSTLLRNSARRELGPMVGSCIAASSSAPRPAPIEESAIPSCTVVCNARSPEAASSHLQLQALTCLQERRCTEHETCLSTYTMPACTRRSVFARCRPACAGLQVGRLKRCDETRYVDGISDQKPRHCFSKSLGPRPPL